MADMGCMPRKLSEEEAIASMRSAGLEPLTPYSGASAPWPSRCLTCGSRDCAPMLVNVRAGAGGCRTCKYAAHAAKQRKTEAEAGKLLHAVGLTPLEPYPGSGRPWRARCLICGAEVAPRLAALLSGQGGCRRCGRARAAEKLQLTEDAAARSAVKAGMKPVMAYPGSRRGKWLVACVWCGAEEESSYLALKGRPGGAGCSACRRGARRERRAAEAYELASKARFIPSGKFPGWSTPWDGACSDCGSKVRPVMAKIRTGANQACRACSYRVRAAAMKRPEAEANREIRSLGFEPQETYPGANIPWRLACADCGTEVARTLGSVRTGKGCVTCTGRGFRRDSPSLLYLVEQRGAYKLGIANVGSGRIREHARNGWTLRYTYQVASGDEALRVEQAVLSWLRDECGIPECLDSEEMRSGWTETFSTGLVDADEVWWKVLAEAS